MQTDLFAAPVTPTPSQVIGLVVDLSKDFGGGRCCGNNLAKIQTGKGLHFGELRCTRCDRHKGWLSKSTAAWIEEVIAMFGQPTKPLIIRTPAARS
jgi:hypothetical protein